MTDYLALLRQKTPTEATAQTAKSTLRSLCSSPTALKCPISSEITSWRWLVHFADRDSLEVSVSPAASHAEVLASYPDALAAETFVAELEEGAAPITCHQESAVVGWLADIGETDHAIATDVLIRCKQDSEARAYYLGRARRAVGDGLDDRRFCTQCENLRSGVCSVAKPGGVVSAPRGYRPVPDILHRCAGYSPTTNCLTRAT
ncbi:hypothetical protein [Candidatus Accumulibacter sp. ACC005]|uniref:hypothetical protein n=1 Tax=Candidatus Accumulibacter sp. ACC005 TaxID=2823331 RepID=UPI0025BF78BD|nr:hypothetical protein [Candidatus Accumulibacter sp. ACC005]